MTVQFVKTAVHPQGMAPADEAAALKVVEVCGRTAYKSEDKITESSAKSFVLMLKKHGHLSVLEHSNIVLRVDFPVKTAGALPAHEVYESLLKGLKNRLAYHRLYSFDSPAAFALAGNFRAWIETLDALRAKRSPYYALFAHHLHLTHPALFEADEPPGEFSRLKVSLMEEKDQFRLLTIDPSCDLPVFIFRFVCDRGITHEVVRHRVLSFTQESTRYVNYNNKGMTLILPEELYPFYDDLTGALSAENPLAKEWMDRATSLFDWYRRDIARGLRPEIARDILPNLLKSEILVSGRWSGWKHFVLLRDSSHAHPRIREIARMVREYFTALGLAFD